MTFIKLYLMRVFIIFLTLLSAGCQTTDINNYVYTPEKRTVKSSYYSDELFKGFELYTIESEQEIFQLTPEMRSLIKREIRLNKPFNDKVHDLMNVIFSKEQIGLSYLNSASLTASQTYLNQEANCLSLTILAYSLAQDANISVKFQSVNVPEYWINTQGYNLMAGHVNVALSERIIEGFNDSNIRTDKVIIDFDPEIRKKPFPTQKINKKQIVALFYTNKAAQAMIDEEYNLAYAYLKQATFLAPNYSPAWGNLGVLYKFIGEYDLAIQSYEHAITLKPNNYTAINNLTFVFDKTGRIEEANTIRQKLHTLRKKNPYYHAFLAETAYDNQNFKQAEVSYKKAIELDSGQHEFHFGLAKSFSAQQQITLASKALKVAMKVSPFADVDRQYLAKLNFLNRY